MPGRKIGFVGANGKLVTVYSSAVQAAKDFGVSATAIRRAASGHATQILTHGGWFVFMDEVVK